MKIFCMNYKQVEGTVDTAAREDGTRIPAHKLCLSGEDFNPRGREDGCYQRTGATAERIGVEREAR